MFSDHITVVRRFVNGWPTEPQDFLPRKVYLRISTTLAFLSTVSAFIFIKIYLGIKFVKIIRQERPKNLFSLTSLNYALISVPVLGLSLRATFWLVGDPDMPRGLCSTIIVGKDLNKNLTEITMLK